MTEESKLTLQDNKASLGEIEIAPEVIEVISGIAASKVEGVYAMHGSLTSGVTELFGRVNHKKGVRLTVDEEGLKVDVYCYLNYGVAVPKVALEMQEKIRQQLLFMTDIELTEVNIHVVAIVPEKAEIQKLIDLEDEDGEDA
ncbi:Asp23/Gls24 family envelope stress response protein [Carnobacterium divergens]|uniref:Asp23/Gls24 family envelope stress response protein n=1 Tax=Carnobacterium divergens TaxID=2748 RepID=UPI00128D592F|nr:Asp23/Gls24 family envelope stress response protein [Carnobacterium divergens]MPQ21784.1 Asp23/Gls24 family envelope stress response protein [Carnobacterium divergens]